MQIEWLLRVIYLVIAFYTLTLGIGRGAVTRALRLLRLGVAVLPAAFPVADFHFIAVGVLTFALVHFLPDMRVGRGRGANEQKGNQYCIFHSGAPFQ